MIFTKETRLIYKRLNNKENNFFINKRILLLGSDGFIGKAFIKYFSFLIYNGIKLKLDCVDNNISSKKQSIKFSDHIQYYHQDIMNYKITKKYDVIIFLAGIASPTIYKKHPLEALEVSYNGAKKYLEYSKKSKSQFIYFSSSEIYGNPDKLNLPTSEDYYGYVNSFGPRSCYDEGKRVGETLCYIYKDYFKTNIKIIRPFNVFGPEMSPSDDRVIPKFLRKIKKQQPLTIYSKGDQTRSYCYITDAMVGFIKVITFGKMGNIYNVGNDKEEISVNQLATKMKKVFGKKVVIKKIKYPNIYPGDEPMRRCPNLKKIRKDTNFKPVENLENSLRYLKNHR
mgnify:CR=1 FL=1